MFWIAVALVAACIAPFLWFWLRSSDPPDESSTYVALWQLQMALVIAALPLLIFLIQFASERRPGFQRTADVLAHHTYLLPIAAFGFACVPAIALGASWLRSPEALSIAYVLFLASLLLTFIAFMRLLLLLFDDAKLEGESTKLLLERFEDVLEHRFNRRLATIVTRDWLAERNVEMSAPPLGQRDSWIEVSIPQDGLITDVNLWLLGDLLDSLPRPQEPEGTPEGGPGAVAEEPQSMAAAVRPSVIRFPRNVGDLLRPDEPVLYLQVDAFINPNPLRVAERLGDVFQLG